MDTITQKEVRLILLDIRSVENVASIFRTADCAGVSKIYLVGVTPAPIDRFKRARQDFAKVALGAEKIIPYEQIESVENLIEKLKEQGFEIVALEQDERSIDYKKFEVKNKIALILGAEVTGVVRKVLDRCDSIIEIPMLGKKESLNVSVATAVALFRIMEI